MTYWRLQTKYIDQLNDETAWRYVNWETGHQVTDAEFGSVFTDFEKVKAEALLPTHSENAGLMWRWEKVTVTKNEKA